MKKQIERLNKEVQTADEKAIKLLSQLAHVMSNIDGSYDTRFKRLLKEVVEGGGGDGGYVENWKDGMHDLKKKMEAELLSQEDSNN